VARIIIVGGGCPGRRLAQRLLADGHAVRITTRDERRRAGIEAIGAECWIGTPDRLLTLRGSLDRVAVACWMLAGARGRPEQLRELHTSRLQYFLTQAIDTTVRGFVYDAAPRNRDVSDETLRDGAAIVRRLTALNQIPAAVIGAGAPGASFDADAWLAEAAGAIDALLGVRA
jgi:hypothetical protein